MPTVFLMFVLLYCNALRKREELDLNALELFDTYTSMLRADSRSELAFCARWPRQCFPLESLDWQDFFFS